MKHTIFTLVVVIVVMFSVNSFAQNKQQSASTSNVKNEVAKEKTEKIECSIKKEELCNTIDSTVKVETLLIDGQYVYRLSGVSQVILYTNDFTNKKKSHTISAVNNIVDLTEKKLEEIKTKEESETISFDVIRNGKYAFVTGYHAFLR